MKTKPRSGALPTIARLGLVLTLAAAGVAVALVDSSAAALPTGYIAGNVRVVRAVKAFEATHAHDFVGLNQAIVTAGGDPVRFSFPGAGLTNLSPEAAQAAYDRAQADGASTEGTINPGAFNVSGYWSHVVDSFGEWWTWFGSWNFNNDSYRAAGTPLDAMAVQTRDVPSSCWRMDGDDGWLYTSEGGTPNLMSRRSSDFDSAVYNIDDSWGDTFYIDHGTVDISYQRYGGCGSSVIYGKTFFEHNYGCDCSWSFSISASAFNLSYSKSLSTVPLQKSTALTSTWT